MISLSRVTVVCGLSLLVGGLAQAEDWKLVKEEDGIKVYLSTVQGSKYKAYRGVTTVSADVATLRILQDDVQGSCQWIHACAEQSLLKHDGVESWVYTRFDMPWPVEARDSILRVVTEQGADGSLTRQLEGQPQYLPQHKAHTRVASLKGFWRFVPQGDGKVEVIYQVHTEPGGSVPSWLANSFVVDAPFNSLSGLRALAEKH